MERESFDNYKAIIGCDEVGRGPIAGPVNGCAVKITAENSEILEKLLTLNITDSKKLSDKKRKKILESLKIKVDELKPNNVYKNNTLGDEFEFCIGEHSHDEIDEMNILQASMSAMRESCKKLGTNETTKTFVDGNKTFDVEGDIESVVKGDSKLVTIGLASIIAKVFRDEKMAELDLKYPGYNLGKHAGYPTKEHKDAVKRLGPSPIHRKTFKGVKEYIQ